MGHDQPSNKDLDHMDRVFTSMDRDGDGVVTKEEFITYCYNTHAVTQSMAFLP